MTRATGTAMDDPELGPAPVGTVVDDPDDGHLRPGQQAPTGSVPVQLGANIAELRRVADISAPELAARSGITSAAVLYFEAGRHIPTLLVALKIAGSFGTSIDRLTAGVYWNPGPTTRDGVPLTPRAVRFEGYFSTRPVHLRPDAPSHLVGTRSEVAAVIGRNLRDTRRRRHISQRDLGPPTGLEQTHVSKIELGQLEPTLPTVIGLARELEVPIEALLAGMRWGGQVGPPDAWRKPSGPGGRPRDLHSLDAVIARGCREGKTPSAIARDIHVDEPTVRRCIERLRRNGRSLVADPTTWTKVDLEEEMALRHEEDLRASDPIGDEDAAMFVARNLRLHRRRQGTGQERLSALGGFGASSISQFERTAPNFFVTHLVRLAAALRTPCSHLTEGLRWDHVAASFLLARHPETSDRSPASVIGANARRIRQAARLPESTVASRVGRRSNYFNALEHGRSMPRPFTLLMLAHALEVEVGELLAGVRDWYVRPLPPHALTEDEEAMERASQQERLLRLWGQNADLRSISEALEMKPQTVFAAVNRLREAGVDVPYRKAPMTPPELSLRMRRRRASRPLVVR